MIPKRVGSRCGLCFFLSMVVCHKGGSDNVYCPTESFGSPNFSFTMRQNISSMRLFSNGLPTNMTLLFSSNKNVCNVGSSGMCGFNRRNTFAVSV